MKSAKRILALICVVSICMVLLVTPAAKAAGGLIPQSFGAWISAGLMSLNIIGQSLLPAPGPIDPYFIWLASPASVSQSYEYPVGQSVLQDYLNASTIRVRQGVTTIDGVSYDEVFVEPGTFTSGLKTNLFDFKTKWNILSGQSGISLASGVGHKGGLPVFYTNNQYNTQKFAIPGTGRWQIGEIGVDRNSIEVHFYSPNGTAVGLNTGGRDVSSVSFPGYPSATSSADVNFADGTTSTLINQIKGLTYDTDEFNFGYTSGVVPATQSEIPENYGLSLQIPHEQLQTFYNTYPQYNVDNSVINIYEDQIDIDELTQAIFDQITSMEDIRADWTEVPEPEPEPPGPVEDILDGVNTLIAQQNTQISQQKQQVTIEQQQLQQQQAISQDTGTISQTIQEIATLPDVEEELPDFKFDLRELFPFCIPFDIYRLLSSFDAEPIAPHVQLPIVIQSIGFSYNLDLDFSAWNPVAQAMRTAELIVYAIGLAWATGKVIKW